MQNWVCRFVKVGVSRKFPLIRCPIRKYFPYVARETLYLKNFASLILCVFVGRDQESMYNRWIILPDYHIRDGRRTQASPGIYFAADYGVAVKFSIFMAAKHAHASSISGYVEVPS
ncbi:hypothetical protein SBA1_30037 [Candidatus Sulfotelmatobacter kueseliae]|uniref:Uncharacterized protein n=1 Tax=Candidatus Sulfotelmatobacter kueseliae TaxID=2042962 RepID=A0A2U3KKL9_9BACT|nr:hypothetical protein SBA1_30037 [Candidatus Sulfotelmatobacter kueseliae]